MRTTLFALLIAIGFTPNSMAQTFDNIVNFPANTSYPGWYDQPRVISHSNQGTFYALSYESPFASAFITEYDANGNPQWSSRVSHNSQPVFYTSMCFNTAETELVLVGTIGSGTNRQMLVTRFNIAAQNVTGTSTSLTTALSTAWLEGIAIKPYPGGYVVGGNRRSCYTGCHEMFLAELTPTLAVTSSMYFTSATAKEVIFRDMSVEPITNEVTLMGFKDDIEVVLLKYDYSLSTISNETGIVYREILETPPHMLYEPLVMGPQYYIGAGISDQAGRIHVMLTQTDNNFAVNWAKKYADGSGGQSAQIWSPGRLVLFDNTLITAFQTSNNSTPDNGIIRVNKTSGAFGTAISYNNWSLAALYPVSLVTNAGTIMTEEAFQKTRIFDGDVLATNNIGCGNFSRTIFESDLTISQPTYSFIDNPLGPSNSLFMNAADINGTYDDCNGNPIGTYKRDNSTDIEENIAPSFSIYPNPAKDVLTVNLGDIDANELIISDRLGRTVHRTSSVKSNQQIDLSSFESGTYFIKILHGQTSSVIPFHKE